MRNGTQEELDAAREDAEKLPFDAVFITKRKEKGSLSGEADPSMPIGEKVVRGAAKGMDDFCGSYTRVAFKLLDNTDYWYVEALDLEPIK